MLGSTVACLSPMKNGFDAGLVHVGFVDRFFSVYFGFLLWLSRYSCSRLVSFTYQRRYVQDYSLILEIHKVVQKTAVCLTTV